VKQDAQPLEQASVPETPAAPDQETKTPAERLKAFLRDTIFLLPSAVKLVRGLLRDPRVPRKCRIAIRLYLYYLLCPLDLIPDWFPGVGHIDDWLLALVLLDWLLNAIPEQVIRDHWDHAWDVVALARRIRPLMPTSVARQLFSWSAEAWRWGARQVLSRLKRKREPAATEEEPPEPPGRAREDA